MMIRCDCFMSVATVELTGLLEDWKQGDPTALQKLTPLIYDELRRIAHRYAHRERNGHTLETTALVNEAYLRLAGGEKQGAACQCFLRRKHHAFQHSVHNTKSLLQRVSIKTRAHPLSPRP